MALHAYDHVALPAFDVATKPVLVLGLGNILIQDEGIGVRVVEHLQQEYDTPEDVEILDGGTAGMALYEHIIDRDYLIVIDAVNTGQPAGTLVKLIGDEVPAFFRNKVSPHQMALADILAALKIAGEEVHYISVIGVEPASLQTSIELSDTIAAQLEPLVQATLQELHQLGYPLKKKVHQ